MKTREEIVAKVNELIAVVDDLIDEAGGVGWEIIGLIDELYPKFAESRNLSDVTGTNDRLIASAALHIAMLPTHNYKFDVKEMLGDSNELAEWQWEKILSMHHSQCFQFWKNSELRMSDEDALKMARIDIENCSTNPFKPNGEEIPKHIKKKFLEEHCKVDGTPISLDVVERGIDSGYTYWRAYKEMYYKDLKQ